jgi:predicted enzyme related to lactoylglutathione lyase
MEKAMNLASVRIVTEDVNRLVGFYETMTGVAADRYSEDFAELVTPSCTLAISSTRAVARFQAGAARGGANQSAIVEFRVDDVDAEYRKLAGVIGEAVQTPTTMPWGNRSLLFRDPDGNLINLFAPVTAEAIKRFDRSLAKAL